MTEPRRAAKDLGDHPAGRSPERRMRERGSCRAPVIEVAAYFLKLGCLGFGGPAATLSMMERELVGERGWVEPAEFGRWLALTKLMPGPVATMVAITLGRLRAGRLGGWVAGLGFVLPCYAMMVAIAWLYFRTDLVAGAPRAWLGLQIGAVSVVAASVWSLGRGLPRSGATTVFLALGAVVTFAVPRWEPVAILIGGLVWALLPERPLARAREAGSVLLALFLTGLKGGTLVFGTGLAIVPLLEADFVTRTGWLTQRQFLEGLALGQATPGPVVISVAFYGFGVAGLAGSALATAGIFAPSFLNALVLLPWVDRRWGDSTRMRRFAAAAVPIVVGGLAGSALRLAAVAGRETQAAFPAQPIFWGFAAAWGIAWILLQVRRKWSPLWALGASVAVFAAMAGLV